MSPQLGETLRQDQPHWLLLAVRWSGGDGIALLRGSTQSLTTIEIRGSSGRFLEEGFWTITGIRPLGISLVAMKCATPYQ